MKAPNPKKKYGDAKIPLQLVPPSAMIAIAQGLAEGAIKYDPWNWRVDDVEIMTYVGAIYRHLAAYVEGEHLDPDSPDGKTHLSGAIASLAILIDAGSVGSLIDNRPGKKSCGTLAALQQGARGGRGPLLSDLYLPEARKAIEGEPLHWPETGIDKEPNGWAEAIRQIDQGIPSCRDNEE